MFITAVRYEVNNLESSVVVQELFSNFQAVIFGINFLTVIWTCIKLFKNIFNGVQTEAKGEINTKTDTRLIHQPAYTNEPHHKKTHLRGLRPGKIQPVTQHVAPARVYRLSKILTKIVSEYDQEMP